MSRIGKKPVVVPAGVEVTVDANNVVTVKGPKGQLSEQISKLIKVEVEAGKVLVSRASDARTCKNFNQQYGCWRNTGIRKEAPARRRWLQSRKEG